MFRDPAVGLHALQCTLDMHCRHTFESALVMVARKSSKLCWCYCVSLS